MSKLVMACKNDIKKLGGTQFRVRVAGRYVRQAPCGQAYKSSRVFIRKLFTVKHEHKHKFHLTELKREIHTFIPDIYYQPL